MTGPLLDDVVDALVDLIGRLDAAEVRLVEEAERHPARSALRAHLASKANGVVLARSYAREALNMLRRGERKAGDAIVMAGEALADAAEGAHPRE